MPEEALCFNAILHEELDEVERRRKHLVEVLAEEGAAGPQAGPEPPLYPTRRRSQRGPFPLEASEQAGMRARAEEDAVEAANPAQRRHQQAGSAIRRANRSNLFGVAFSGGGIRSATFNLGILQGLAKRELLHRVDYLSTISGGGYIGAWLEAWIYRRGVREVERRLSADRKDQPGYKNPPEVEFLREYSNYLTPRRGFLGADTWTAIAIYVRNLLLNQLILILFATSVLLVPRALTTFAVMPPSWFQSHSYFCSILAYLLIGAATIPATYSSMANYSKNPEPDRVVGRVLTMPSGRELEMRLVPSEVEEGPEENRSEKLLETNPPVEIWDANLGKRKAVGQLEYFKPFRVWRATRELKLYFEHEISAKVGKIEAGDLVIAGYPESSRTKPILLRLVIPVFVGALMLACLLVDDGRHADVSRIINLASPWWWSTTGAGTLLVLWLLALGRNLDRPKGNQSQILYWIQAMVSPLAGGATGGLLLWAITPILQRWKVQPAGMWMVLGFGTPIIALILLASTVIQTGILGAIFSDPRREWWARFVALFMTVCFGWTAGFALAGYGPLLLLWLSNFPKSSWLTALGWVASTVMGVLGAKKTKAETQESENWKRIALSVTPYIFVMGLLMLVSLGIHLGFRGPTKFADADKITAEKIEISISGNAVLTQTAASHLELELSQKERMPITLDGYWKCMRGALGRNVYWALLGCSLACILLALVIDLNEFSMHYLYRNRLVRCYLGASHRERVPNPFTGFDVNDDVHLRHLTTTNSYYGPFPLFGAALNLVHGKDLAWQERKAESFVMSPLHSGFDAWFERSTRPGQPEMPSLADCGFRPTESFAYPEGFFLGTAMAISGAAASPNMGHLSSPALGFLMTVFNVRLGWWVGNPRREDHWRRAGPRFGLGYLLVELFGATDDTKGYVYLSDGGHFENLGLYELVKRRCRFIIVSDADADENLTFCDLAGAIRKCRLDMGIDIRLRTEKIVAIGEPPFSKWHCAVGEILYERSDPEAKNGILLYLKASLTSDEPADVLNFKTHHRSFPHQTTADQWFTESQFESYRALGEHIISSALRATPTDSSEPLDEIDLEELFESLGKIWKNPETIQT